MTTREDVNEKIAAVDQAIKHLTTHLHNNDRPAVDRYAVSKYIEELERANAEVKDALEELELPLPVKKRGWFG